MQMLKASEFKAKCLKLMDEVQETGDFELDGVTFPAAEIVLEFCGYTDGAWMSAKKDHLVNIGGWLAVNHEDVFEVARNMVVVYEGLHTYGGMAGRDMEALAIGIGETIQDDHIRARVGQVR